MLNRNMLVHLFMASLSLIVVSPASGDPSAAASSKPLAGAGLRLASSRRTMAETGRLAFGCSSPHVAGGLMSRHHRAPPNLVKSCRGPGARSHRHMASRLRMSSNDELPRPVTSPFPLWDENVLQTLGLINPDDAKVSADWFSRAHRRPCPGTPSSGFEPP
jgi:hypothetical protein